MAAMARQNLERSCATDWLNSAPATDGLQRIEAFFTGHAYAPHRHDTYAIGYTINGVQRFDYRGSRTDSTAGRIIVIHPDELHDGKAGSETGFLYRMLYIEPAEIRDALGPLASTLPFVPDAVFSDPRLLPVLRAAFADMSRPLDPLQRDQLLTVLAEGLLIHGQGSGQGAGQSLGQLRRGLIDLPAMERARDYLETHAECCVRSEELEQITGHDRYGLARQFRAAYGTSPYRYLMMRRLERARDTILQGTPLADAAAQTGFSDQAHLSRQFRAAYGMPPGRWRKLHARPAG
jgi:AraC-like DNA-binding protein